MRTVIITLVLSVAITVQAQTVGTRPYEMVNANRIEDTHPPLVNFESLHGWTVETVESEAKFETSRTQQLWGSYVGKLTYKKVPSQKAGRESVPLVRIKPPKPLEIAMPFDCVNLWLYGNNWAWESDPSTPRVQVDLLLQNADGKTINVPLDTVRWKEWFLIHRKLPPEQLNELGNKPLFAGFEIRNGTNTDSSRILYFDNLAFFKEELKPLQYEQRPQLPFPNRANTVLPDNYCNDYKNTVTENNGTFRLQYEGTDSKVIWIYTPKTGTFSDLCCEITSKDKKTQTLRFNDGGVKFANNAAPATLMDIAVTSPFFIVSWRFGDNIDDSKIVDYKFEIKQKSLIVDIQSTGGTVETVTFGSVLGAENPRLVTIPYLTGNGANRPAVLASGAVDNPLFFLPMVDHTQSNASELFFDNKITDDNIVSFNGGARYKPKTDGKHNDVSERFFFNVSPTFEEVLPTIPNPPSPWKETTAQRVWRSHGASNHDSDYKYWQRLKRYGVDKMLITDHETLWRDGGESFTFRTSAAPAKGGDEAQKAYTQEIHALGYMYGPYNNYTDYAPVNEYWNEDWVTRLPDGNYQPAWARCYNPKPRRAAEVEPKITEIIQQKFRFNTAYCDVHTAVTPWHYVDYDAREARAGMFAATFDAYGEILLHQKKIWNGPVYSEGNNHWYYSGLTDGNYAQDQAYRIPQNPWLVDFDLRKIHPLENNFGMGSPDMFGKTSLDRFLAATVAFGHTGFLAMDFGFAEGIRSYFMIQAVAQRYGTQKVKSIHYADENGKFLTTSQAIIADAVKLNRLRIEYEDGLTIYVNGNDKTLWYGKRMSSVPLGDEEQSMMLVPNGWFVDDPKKELSVSYSPGAYTYIDSPAYRFAENSKYFNLMDGTIFCDKQLIVLKNVDDKGSWDMIVGEQNYEGRSTVHGVQLENLADADVAAFDIAGNELGKAQTRYTNGLGGAMVYVMPMTDAFRYRLTPKAKPDKVIFDGLGTFAQEQQKLSMPVLNSEMVSPGQSLVLRIGTKDSFEEFTAGIPLDAKPYSLHWVEKDGLWAAFRVFPLCSVTPIFKQDKPDEVKFEFGMFPLFSYCFMVGEDSISLEFNHNGVKKERNNLTLNDLYQRIAFDVEPATEPQELPLRLKITAEQKNPKNKLTLEKKYTLKSDWTDATKKTLITTVEPVKE